MRDGWERKVRSSSFFYQNMASRARKKKNKSRPSVCVPTGRAVSVMQYIRVDDAVCVVSGCSICSAGDAVCVESVMQYA